MDRYAVAQSVEALRQKRKVAGSIPYGVSNFFLHNSFCCIMAQLLTEEKG
jgi:hypothetical protein